jgi:DNA-binding Lrp family transcriptional regulator
MRFQNVDVSKEKEIMEYAAKHKSIGWIVNTRGPWDLVFVIWAQTIPDFKEVVDEISYKYGNYFKEKYVSIATKVYHFKHNYIYDAKDYSELIVGGNKNIESYDETDLKILGLLAKDGRISTLAIAKKLDVTPNGIKYRMRKLRNKGIIQGYRPYIDLTKLGFQRFKVILLLKDLTQQKMMKLIEFLRCEPYVVYVTEAVGHSDLEFEIDVENSSQLHEFMNQIRVEFADTLKDYQTCMTYSEIGINYLPGEKHRFLNLNDNQGL